MARGECPRTEGHRPRCSLRCWGRCGSQRCVRAGTWLNGISRIVVGGSGLDCSPNPRTNLRLARPSKAIQATFFVRALNKAEQHRQIADWPSPEDPGVSLQDHHCLWCDPASVGGCRQGSGENYRHELRPWTCESPVLDLYPLGAESPGKSFERAYVTLTIWNSPERNVVGRLVGDGI
jgi:hypothetical protein